MREQRTGSGRAYFGLPLIESLEARLLLSTTGEELAAPIEAAAAGDKGEVIVGTDKADALVGTTGDDRIKALDGDDVILWDGVNSEDDRIDGGGDFDLLFAAPSATPDDVVDVTKSDGVTNVEAVITLAGDDQVSVVLKEILHDRAGNVFVALMGDGNDTLIIDATGRWLGVDGEAVKNGEGDLLNTEVNLTHLTSVPSDVASGLVLQMLQSEVSSDGLVVLTFAAASGSGEVVSIVTDAETVVVGTDRIGYQTYSVDVATGTLTLVS